MNFFALVEGKLQQVEDRMRAFASGGNADLQTALELVLRSGGKRVRPTVVLLTASMLGGDEERVINLAAAIELLHTATLVHDDLIDGALLRRGTPTLNTRWSPAATVLTGDYLFARAAELAASTGSVEVMKIFAKTLSTIVGGEINQLLSSKGLVNREEYHQRIYAKTASLFETALHTAALISTDDLESIARLKQYGYETGMAFQIVDDILDFTGDQTRIGKPVASDLRHGTVTLPVINFIDSKTNENARGVVLEVINGDEKQVPELVARIRESGAIEASMQEAQQFIGRAIAALKGLPPRQERQALIEVANYVVNREI